MTKWILIIAVSMGVTMPSFSNEVSEERKQRVEQVFNDLRATNLEILDKFYDEDAEFIDPLGKHKGIQPIKDYYENLYKAVIDIRFEVEDHIIQGDKHVLVWVMKLKATGIKDGEEISLAGNSVIYFNEKNLVGYHRDYYDMGEFVYEKVPVLGWVIGKIKKRLRPK